MKMKFEEWLKKREWQDFALVAILIFILVLQYNTISQYQQLPSPLYGGDKYLQLAAIIHTADGGNPLGNFRNSDAIPNYLPLYTVIVGGSARIFSIEPMTAMFLFSYIFVALSIIILYFLGCALFKDKTIALLFPLLYRSFIVIIKYGHFARWVIFPLFFLTLFLTLFEKNLKKKWIYAGITGVVFGLGSLSHGTIFPGLSIFMVLVLVYMFLFDYLKRENKKFVFDRAAWKNDFKNNLVAFLLITIPGFLIAQLYWFTLIKSMIIGTGLSQVSLTQYTTTLLKETPAFVLWFKEIFLSFVDARIPIFSIHATILSVVVILAVVSLFFLKKYTNQIKYSVLIFIGSIFLLLVFTLVSLAFGTNMNTIMRYTTDFWASVARIILGSILIYILLKILKKKSKTLLYSVVGVLILVLLISHYIEYKGFIDNNRWHQVGTRPLSPHFIEVSKHIRANTDVYDVILTNKELGFAINALTGRKLVAQPDGQKNQLYDFATRDRDLAVLLYANASADKGRVELFRKYDVKYFYWDPYWLESEFKLDAEGGIQYLFDPIELLRTDENREMLERYDIKYSEEYLEINPNHRGNVPKFEVFLIYPNFNATHPWDASLDKFLQIEKEIKTPQGQSIAKFYKVVY